MFSLNALFLALLLAFHSVVRADEVMENPSFYNPLFKAKVDKIIQKFHSKKMTIPEFKRIMIEKKNVLVIDTREEEEFRAYPKTPDSLNAITANAKWQRAS